MHTNNFFYLLISGRIVSPMLCDLRCSSDDAVDGSAADFPVESPSEPV